MAEVSGHLGCPFSPRTPPLSPEDAQGPWAEEVLDSNFLGSGEELDLLSEILDTLSIQTKSMGSLRPSQSLDCCHAGDLDSCFSLVRGPPPPHHPIFPQLPIQPASSFSPEGRQPALSSHAPPSLTYQEEKDGNQMRRNCQSPSPCPCLQTCHPFKTYSLWKSHAPQRTPIPSFPQAPTKKSSLPPTSQQLLQTQAAKGTLNALLSLSPPPFISPLFKRQLSILEPGRALAPGSPRQTPSPALRKVPNFWPPWSPTLILSGHPSSLSLPWTPVYQRTPEPSLPRSC